MINLRVLFQVLFQTASGPIVVTKPHVFEADMHDSSRRAVVPNFNALFHDDNLVTALNAAAPQLDLCPGTSGKTVKLQVRA